MIFGITSLEVQLIASTFAWMLIALLAMIDATRQLIRCRRGYRRALPLGNGRLLTAHGRYKRAVWFFLGFAGSWVVSGAAFVDLLYPPVSPEADVLTVLRFATVFTLFCFWRAKRADVATGREIEAYNRELQRRSDAEKEC